MIIGTVREIKTHEYRVGLTPSCVKAYTGRGHKVLVEAGAGIGAGFDDDEYLEAGAVIENDRKTVYDSCEMIVKVKEPQSEEYELFHENQILYTYLHLAAAETLTRALLDRGIRGVAYETMETSEGVLPCLKPMSEIAGRLSIQEGAKYLEKPFGGRGILLGGVPGVQRGKIAILGGGVVGINACKIAVGFKAEVTVLDINPDRLEYFDDIFAGSVSTLYSTEVNIERVLAESDVVIGAVLIPGARAPKLVRKEHLLLMKPGSVLVDVAIDQGGCFETSRPTTHDNPTYTDEGIVHYCVSNMPGAVALTSTMALTSTTLPYGLMIADLGLEKACRESGLLLTGLNLYRGKCTFPEVADAFDLEYTPAMEAVG
jgi:alanine dehydrogenase